MGMRSELLLEEQVHSCGCAGLQGLGGGDLEMSWRRHEHTSLGFWTEMYMSRVCSHKTGGGHWVTWSPRYLQVGGACGGNRGVWVPEGPERESQLPEQGWLMVAPQPSQGAGQGRSSLPGGPGWGREQLGLP